MPDRAGAAVRLYRVPALIMRVLVISSGLVAAGRYSAHLRDRADGVRCGGYAQRKITSGNEVSRNSYLGQHISARGRRICFLWIPRPAIDDVPVQRHSAYVELSGHGPHGQSVETVTVDDRKSGHTK